MKEIYLPEKEQYYTRKNFNNKTNILQMVINHFFMLITLPPLC